MSKSTITRLFVGAVLAMVVGLLIGIAAIVAALAGGAVTIGGPTFITVNGAAFAGPFVWLIIAAVTVSGGTLAAMASWIGALFNTYQLEDRTWFVALLVLGLVSLGWIAMVAYVAAGPDGTRPTVSGRGLATTTGA